MNRLMERNVIAISYKKQKEYKNFLNGKGIVDKKVATKIKP